MRKSIRNILVLLLSLTAIICVSAGLVACTKGVELTGLSIEDARTVFLIGDEFEYGENFKVYAVYSDGTRTDVTEAVEIRKENGFDMSVSGDYQITVSYENKKEVYTVYVNDFESPLRKIQLDTSNVQKSFELGEKVSLAGLMVKSTYENAQGVLIDSTSSSLRNLTVQVTDKDGNDIGADGVFSTLGDYTVTVSSGNVKDSYTVSVSGINISTVQGALAVGNYFKYETVTGTVKIKETLPGREPVDTFDYEYEYSENYTRIKENIETKGAVQHISIDSEGVLCVTEKDGKIEIPNTTFKENMIKGVPVHLWYYGLTEYGIEDVLTNLYEEAVKCTNGDLVETADEANRKYTFSFSGLIFRSNDANYFENSVSFTLGVKNNIENVEFTQTYWENNTTAEGQPGWKPNFSTDENGITKPDNRFTHRLQVAVEQVTGARTAENPYSREALRVKDYKLEYNGEELGDNGVIDCELGTLSSLKLTVFIKDLMPESSDFAMDSMYFSLEGGVAGEVDSSTFLYESGFMASRKGNTISVQIPHGGTYKLILRTVSTRKTITFNVVGAPPKSITAQIYNDAAEFFTAGDSRVLSLNRNVYFYGAVNEYANPAQTAKVTSSNAGNATIERATLKGVECFRFRADKEGVYTVEIKSDVADKSCVFTFTVSDMPDYGNLLKGKYTVQDREENIFVLSFNPSEELKGSVTVTKTPTELDGTPITDEAKTAVYSYTADTGNLTIDLKLTSGTTLGVSLTVDANGRLVLIDQYKNSYVLNPMN